MPLRHAIKSAPETLSDLLLAAEDRYREAEQLLLADEYDGAIYLLGYSAEIWLKSACLRLSGHGPAVEAKAALPPLRKWMATVAPHVIFTDYHDLCFFAECILQLRYSVGRPLDPGLTTELDLLIVNGLGLEWIVDMRYRRCGLSAADAWSALNQCWWLKTNWLHLT